MEVNLIVTYIIVAFLCFASLHLFIKYAHRFGLSDQPNHRSSHDYTVVRGGGIVFGLGWLLACAFQDSLFSIFNLGLLLLMIIGFLDDIKGLSRLIRLFFQFVSVILLTCYFDLFQTYGPFWTVLIVTLISYLINVFNFMDGINGILGLYSITILYFLLHYGFSAHEFAYVVLLISVLTFLFFNLRIKARVFSGDVGSLSISYLLIGGLVKSIIESDIETNGFQFMILLIIPVSIFFMDSFSTIIHRLWLRENILLSHRFHLYQILTPRFISSQPIVSFVYAFMQLLVIYLFNETSDVLILFLFLIFLFFIFIFTRLVMLRKINLQTGR